ncbi:hypothetical protein [Okeania sp. SIO2B3]|uniref:hypothetical protein n=1 Tax=Okeania sp. SIO2B3 TaxID=2607784 RepID=UPI0013C0EF90|nr:hypothetical protein [Okeania sp. SIO2B3]NET43452.1 hypothetical protein [Okeania sp. SIO2B3]
MNLLKINQKIFQLGVFTLGTFALLTSSSKVLASNPEKIENKSILLTQASREDWRICQKKGENWSEVKYFESKNYFANICRSGNGQLTLVAGAKSNPNKLLELPVSGEQGYLAIDGSKTFMIDNSHFSMAINGMVVRKEQVTYRGE